MFEVSSSTDQTAWTQVLEHELPDPRALGCNIPLVELGITPTVGRFIELKLKSYHGVTYALRFFSVDYELVN